MSRLRQPPQIGERRGQFPVVERRGGLEPALQHGVDQAVVEVETLFVDRPAPLGQDARPAGGEAVDVEVRAGQQVEVRLVAVVVIAGDRAVLGAHDVAGGGGEVVPVGAPGAALGVPLDLVARRGRPEAEILRKVGAAKLHRIVPCPRPGVRLWVTAEVRRSPSAYRGPRPSQAQKSPSIQGASGNSRVDRSFPLGKAAASPERPAQPGAVGAREIMCGKHGTGGIA